MATDPHWITGIQAGRLPGGKLPVRMEIDDWWFSKDLNLVNQRTLYVLALSRWQQRGLDQGLNDDLSYFGIAGIHGLPNVPWPRNGAGTGFYCSHHQKTFATWHTPYMVLYEQQLQREMSALIPDTFDKSQQAEYQKAADSWRLPYWDWAMKKPTWKPDAPQEEQYKQPHIGPNVPFAITQPKVQIRTGKGSVEPVALVANPLFQFALKQNTKFGDYKVATKSSWVAKCRVTSRHPKTTNSNSPLFESDYVNGQNQDYRKITAQLQGSVDGGSEYFANSLPEAVYRLMTTRSSSGQPMMPYETFVTNGWKGGAPTDYPSLEAIHDNLHGFIGGAGYMGNPATAAFDPIFWLHHCNVDRLLCIWQELYPAAFKKWLNSDPSNTDDEGPNVELQPFKDDQGKYFTSITASYKLPKFNFTYPELQRWNFKTDQEYIDSIYKTFERLYSASPKTSLLLPQNAEVAQQQMSMMTAKNLEVENFPSALVDMFPTAESTPEKFGKPAALEWKNDDYLLNVLYEPFALEGEAYAIVVYLGDIPVRAANSFGMANFAAENTAISEVFNFSSTAEGRGFDVTGCQNCKKNEADRLLASGQVILTEYLIERIVQRVEYQGLTLRSLDQGEVLAYLKTNLHWVVQTRFGEVIPNTDSRMERLRFSVAHGPAAHNSDPTRLSQYGPYTTIWNVTGAGNPA